MDQSTALLLPVWDAMAEQFLDTECRHRIPHTALTCLDAGLSAREAREVWMRDIAPSVGLNLLAVAGEWQYWEEAWLIAQIAKARRANWLVKMTSHRGLARLSKSMWLPIEHSMRFLDQLERTERETHARALSEIARTFFDSLSSWPEPLEPELLELMRALYPEPFLSIFETAIFDKEASSGPIRVRTLLG